MSKRSPHAQMAAMSRLWPHSTCERGPSKISWIVELQPFSQPYRLRVLWDPGAFDRPWVMLLNPKLRPRTEGAWDEIPHLLFDDENPERAGLCLFDPTGREWSPADLIAETTIKWAAEWLLHYELWLMSGEWNAPGIGPRSSTERRLLDAG